jgi:hypothetical protein
MTSADLMTRLASRVDRLRSTLSVRVQGVVAYTHDLRATTPATDETFRIRRFTPADGPQLVAMHPIARDDIRSRLERGDACYLAFLAGRLCHFAWVQVRGIHVIADVARSETIAPGELWIYHCRTAESARGRRVYPRVLAHILATHRERGFRSAWIYTTLDNTASQRGITAAGFRPREVWCAAKLGPVLRSFPSLPWLA